MSFVLTQKHYFLFRPQKGYTNWLAFNFLHKTDIGFVIPKAQLIKYVLTKSSQGHNPPTIYVKLLCVFWLYEASWRVICFEFIWANLSLSAAQETNKVK